jgi:hypothetical protein
MLRLNTSIEPTKDPNRLGVLGGDLQGFPNGRRLADDVVDIEIQAVMGAAQTGQLVDALATGDQVDANEVAFLDEFPYVALPTNQTAADTTGGKVLAGGGSGGDGTATGSSSSSGSDDAMSGSATEPQTVSENVVPAASSSSWNPMAVALIGGVGGAVLAGGVVLLVLRRRRAAPATPGPQDPGDTTMAI